MLDSHCPIPTLLWQPSYSSTCIHYPATIVLIEIYLSPGHSVFPWLSNGETEAWLMMYSITYFDCLPSYRPFPLARLFSIDSSPRAYIHALWMFIFSDFIVSSVFLRGSISVGWRCIIISPYFAIRLNFLFFSNIPLSFSQRKFSTSIIAAFRVWKWDGCVGFAFVPKVLSNVFTFAD